MCRFCFLLYKKTHAMFETVELIFAMLITLTYLEADGCVKTFTAAWDPRTYAVIIVSKSNI